jgi:alkylresorcinol/alkylpyrone synthase
MLAPLTRPQLAGLASAVPEHAFDQADVSMAAHRLFSKRYPEFARLEPVFHNSGIKRRFSVCPIDWFETGQAEMGWPERSAAFLSGAMDLFAKAAGAALESAALEAAKIDTIITVCSTGIATPTLEARQLKGMGFRDDVRRIPVFGLGCAGGVTGLSLATRLSGATPDENILLVVIETCTLSFRWDELTKSNIVATALFGDGAAAAVISGRASDPIAIFEASGEHTWPDTLDVMGWRVDPSGFGAIFSSSIPKLVRDKLVVAADAFLERHDLCRDDLDGFVFHPGGAKVIEALEGAFDLEQGSLNKEREVLRDYGNMSAPTVLFVLRKALDEGFRGHGLLSALGPGFTASFQTFHTP